MGIHPHSFLESTTRQDQAVAVLKVVRSRLEVSKASELVLPDEGRVARSDDTWTTLVLIPMLSLSKSWYRRVWSSHQRSGRPVLSQSKCRVITEIVIPTPEMRISRRWG